MGQAQMVQYTEGQKFDLHHDWFARPRVLDADAQTGRRRLYNRVATFFAVFQVEGIEEDSGETWFPKVRPVAQQGAWGTEGERGAAQGGGGADGDGKGGGAGRGGQEWREHEDGGLAFKPVPGNAVFWVNLLPNGTGDGRTVHAGLPVKGSGVKTAMNIWPRVFFGPDA